MYGLMQGHTLERSCEIGNLSGAAAVRCVGAEVTRPEWAWFHARVHGGAVGQEAAAASALSAPAGGAGGGGRLHSEAKARRQGGH